MPQQLLMGFDAPQSPLPDSNAGASSTRLVPLTMEVVCGTDFSKASIIATDAASALAFRLREPLVLLHAFDEPSRTLLPQNLRESLRAFEQQQLQEELERLQTDGLVVRKAFCESAPVEALIRFAERPSTRLVIVSSGRDAPNNQAIFGSVAEHVTGYPPAPALLIRNSLPLVEWAQEKRKLRVFVAANFSAASDAALKWVRWLRQVGSCDVTVAYLEFPLVRDSALGGGSAPGAAPLIAKIEQTEEICFRRRVRKLLSTNRVRVCFEKDWGRSDAHLIQLACRERADLIVVGVNERHGLDQIAHHSVSRAIARYAPTNVACIPVSAFPSGDR